MAVPKTGETRAVYVPQERRLWNTIITCVYPILKRDVGWGYAWGYAWYYC